MSYYLSLNGLDVSIARDRSGHEPITIGKTERVFGGSLRSTRRNEDAFAMRGLVTAPLLEADAEQLEGLLSGRGFHFPLQEDLYAAVKRLGPEVGYAASISAAQSMAAFGSYSMLVASGASGPVYPCGFTGNLTVGFWHYISGWTFCVEVYDDPTSTPTRYVNASTQSETWYCMTVNHTTGDVSFFGKQRASDTGSDAYFVDVFILPYKLTQEMITALYNTGSGLRFSDLPRLDLDGDCRGVEPAIEVVCPGYKVGETQLMDSGSLENMRVVSFDLESVNA